MVSTFMKLLEERAFDVEFAENFQQQQCEVHGTNADSVTENKKGNTGTASRWETDSWTSDTRDDLALQSY